jgi:hypothetical protein
VVFFCSEKPDFLLREFMSTTEWIEVLSMATNGSLDNEKVSMKVFIKSKSGTNGYLL